MTERASEPVAARQKPAAGGRDGKPKPTRARLITRSLARFLTSDLFAVPMSILLGIIAWQLIVIWSRTPPYVLPGPGAVFQSVIDHREGLLLGSLITAEEVAIGLILAVVVGIALGTAMSVVAVIDRIMSPLLVVLQTIPKIALAPLFVVWFGQALLPKVLVAAVIAFFPVVIATYVGLRVPKRAAVSLVRSMGATRSQLFVKVLFPGALPSIFGGIKVAATLAVIGAIVGEYIASNQGLGHLQLTGSYLLETPLVLASVAFMSVLGVLFYKLVDYAERWLIPWSIPAAHELDSVRRSSRDPSA